MFDCHAPRREPCRRARPGIDRWGTRSAVDGGVVGTVRVEADGKVGAAPARDLLDGAVMGVRRALARPALRRVLCAYGLSCVVEWTLWTAVLVHTYERSGATAVGFVAIALSLPGALVAPWAGSAGDGARPNRMLCVTFGALTAALSVAAVGAYAGWALVAVILPAMGAVATLAFVGRASRSSCRASSFRRPS